MSKKVLTAEDILNESSSDSDASQSSEEQKPKKATPKKVVAPKPAAEVKQPAVSAEKDPYEQEVFNEGPEVVNRFANIQTSKSAEADYAQPQRFKPEDLPSDKIINVGPEKFNPEGDSQEDSDQEPDFGARRQSIRTTQSEINSKTFTITRGGSNEDAAKALMMAGGPGKESLVSNNFKDEPEPSAEIDDAKLLQMIQDEDSDDSSSKTDSQKKENKSNGSICSEQDLLNRSLEQDEGEDPVSHTNYLRYASDKLNLRFDMLDIIDKNERAFKNVAEKMMQQSSQLITAGGPEDIVQQQRRLTHQKQFRGIADRFFNSNNAQGEPQAIASLEEYICIGSSDGTARLYDTTEQEIKTLTDKSLKGNGVTCIDMKRVDKNQNVFVVCGHSKGQVCIFEIKGLAQQQSFQEGTQQTQNQQADVEYKHRKTLDEIHGKSQIVQIKFVGDFSRETLVVSSDITGLVCITQFVDSWYSFKANSSILFKQRLAPCYSIAPFVQVALVLPRTLMQILNSRSDQNQVLRDRLAQKLKEVAENKLSEAQEEVKPHIVAFGSLEEVYVSMIKPQVQPILSIKRPAYINPGSVPYCDWGLALTPTYRDQAYPCLAIAWGNAIQLAVYSNQKEANQGHEVPQLQLDGFYICAGQSIDSVYFLSESILFIIVNKKDVRILYTQNFTPGVYDDNLQSNQLNIRKVASATTTDLDKQAINMFADLKQKYGPVSEYAEKDSGQKIADDEVRVFDNIAHYQVISEQGPQSNLNVSVCKNFGFNVIAVSRTQIVQRNLIHWEEYLDLIRHTNADFLKVLKAALEIFNGKMIGLAGLPDQREKREELMRERMKDLLRQTINTCIKEFKEGQAVSQKTLRLATEFCIRVGAIDHIFQDLYKLFADANVESMYFDNLDAFILSGKMRAIKIPHVILERLINYYRKKDIQLLEQALLNLNLSKYANSYDVRFICEQEFLSSALIHLLTTMFLDENESDSTTCLSVLCSLFNLMVRAKHKKEWQDVQGLLEYLEKYETSVFELSQEDCFNMKEDQPQKVFRQQRAKKIEVEHSSTYIGYKILWIVTLYLEGKKFPQGNLPTTRWRYYVMDIVRFFTNEKFMMWFLDFDPDSFFSVLKKLFTDHEPFEFITTQDAFLAKNREENPFMEPCYAHTDMLMIFEQKVNKMINAEKETNDGQLTEKAEKLHNAFLFFLTQVSRNKKIPITKAICLKIVREQIAFHKTLYRIPKKDLLDLVPESAQPKNKDKNQCIYTYLIKKNEKDVIQILIGYQDKLTPEETAQLLEEAKSSPLFKLIIYLYQLQGDFQRCLTLFFQIKAIKSDVFTWLSEIQHTLKGQDGQSQEQVEDNDVDNDEEDDNFFNVKGLGSRITFNKMKDLIAKNVSDFVQMDPLKTVQLCEAWFDEDYMLLADELRDHKELAFAFLSAVVQKCEPKIMAEYNQAVLMNNQAHQISNKYQKVLLRLTEILVDKRVKNHNKTLVEYVSRSYWPIDECLTICEKKAAIEAQAVLQRRKGQYKKSIKLYINTIVTLCVDSLIHIISVEKNIRFEDPLCTNEHMISFDQIVQQIIKICAKYGSRQTEKEMEDLWMFAIKSLFEVKTEVFKRMRDMENQDSDSDSDSSADRERHEEEMQFEKFVLIRNQHFLSKMSEHVNLRSVISFLEQCGHAMKYDDFRRTFENKIDTELYFIQILKSAICLVSREVVGHSKDLISDYSKGYKTGAKCDKCKQKLINKFDRQDVWVMSCQHTFHARCIAKSEGTCSVCFNELDVIHSFQMLKKEKSTGSMGSRSTARSNSRSASSQSSDQSDVDNILQKREQSLKRSITLANQQQPSKRRFESRTDKMTRLMTEYENDLKKRDLGRGDFLMLRKQ